MVLAKEDLHMKNEIRSMPHALHQNKQTPETKTLFKKSEMLNMLKIQGEHFTTAGKRNRLLNRTSTHRKQPIELAKVIANGI